MKRIIIIGGNGSGKTTLAKELAKISKLPLIHLDSLYWRDNWQHAGSEEFDDLLQTELNKPCWIIDGNMRRTLHKRLQYCDTVIFLDFPSIICTFRAVKRIIRSHNKSRPDMGGICIEKYDRRSFDFIKSVMKFNKNNRKFYYENLKKAKDVKVIILKDPKQADIFIKQLNEKAIKIK